MNFDELQSAWQSQDHGSPVILDSELLLKKVQEDQRQFETMIFWRDLREIVIAWLLAIFFLFPTLQQKSWSWGLLVLGSAFVGTFMLVDRWIQQRRRPILDASVQSAIQASLVKVRHQIWLLRNIFWWYLLPVAIGLTAVIVDAFVKIRPAGFIGFKVLGLGAYAIVCLLLFWGVYKLNQYAVRKTLDPRRRELESLLENLKT